MNLKLLALVALVVGFILPGLAHADLAAGAAAYQRGDYATAAREFRRAADQGDAGAQFILGAMYESGQSVPRDDAEAVKGFRKAAN